LVAAPGGATLKGEPVEEHKAMNLQGSSLTRTAAAHASVLTHAVLLGALLSLCWAAKLVLITMLVSAVIAFMLEPIATGLERLRVPPTLASLAAVGLLLGAVYGVGRLAYAQASQFVNNLPQYSDRIQKAAAPAQERLKRVTDALGGRPSASTEPGPAPSSGGTTSPAALAPRVGSITEVLVTASFVPFLVYFMLSWRGHVRRGLVGLFDDHDRRKADETLGRIGGVVRAFLVGNAVIGLILGVASAAVFAALHVRDFFFVGPLSGMLSVVPYVGVVLAMVPPLVAGAGDLSRTQTLIVMGTVLALHLAGLNILYPKLIGRRLSLNPLTVTVALLFWGWLWGGFGLLLAIPITGALKALLDHVDGLQGWGRLLGEGEDERGASGHVRHGASDT
jgi:predicted PurR-regulated permease PerM